MERKNARMATFSKWLAGLLPLLALTACLESKPKEHDRKKVDVRAVDTANATTFRFNFAYRNPSADGTIPILVQGAANTNTTMVSTCNGAGTNCVCEYFSNSLGTVSLGTSTTAAYDSVGNFFACTYSGTAASLSGAYIRLRNLNSTKIGDLISVDTTLTAQKLIGSDLDINNVRSIYRYGCKYNFLEKRDGITSPTSFNCTSTLSFCGSTNFCFVEAIFPFHVYSDNHSTNIDKKFTDLIYNAGSTNILCGTQMKQFDCSESAVGASNLMTRSFGLYSAQTGNFQVPVILTPMPNGPSETYGYAAQVGITGNCPPGMIKKDFYNASVPAMANSSLGALTVTEVSDNGVTPSAFAVNRRDGGTCNGTVCTVPNSGTTTQAVIPSPTFTAAGTTFCVIDPAILP